jgi:acetyl-CoA acetyltransferase
MEKMYMEDRAKVAGAFTGAMDVELLSQIMAAFKQQEEQIKKAQEAKGEAPKEKSGQRTVFMDVYAWMARRHMEKYGTTQRQLAVIASKNHFHSSMNPLAQYQTTFTVEEVLAAPEVAWPLTRPMCSPIGDGAAAVVIVSPRKARALGIAKPVRVLTSVLHSGWDHGADEPGTVELCAEEAYREAGLGPAELSLVECHDASAPAELMAYESLGLCAKGEGGPLVDAGATRLGGRIPVNTSGGLLRKGHPVGATGIAQIVELTEQLQGRAGSRQVADARVGLAHNGGGAIGTDAAAMCVTILAH